MTGKHIPVVVVVVVVDEVTVVWEVVVVVVVVGVLVDVPAVVVGVVVDVDVDPSPVDVTDVEVEVRKVLVAEDEGPPVDVAPDEVSDVVEVVAKWDVMVDVLGTPACVVDERIGAAA